MLFSHEGGWQEVRTDYQDRVRSKETNKQGHCSTYMEGNGAELGSCNERWGKVVAKLTSGLRKHGVGCLYPLSISDMFLWVSDREDSSAG